MLKKFSLKTLTRYPQLLIPRIPQFTGGGGRKSFSRINSQNMPLFQYSFVHANKRLLHVPRIKTRGQCKQRSDSQQPALIIYTLTSRVFRPVTHQKSLYKASQTNVSDLHRETLRMQLGGLPSNEKRSVHGWMNKLKC